MTSRSSRGGRGGRGGGGGSTASNAKMLLQRTANEAGLGDSNKLSLDSITRPPLFPSMLWHSSGTVYQKQDTAAPAAIAAVEGVVKTEAGSDVPALPATSVPTSPQQPALEVLQSSSQPPPPPQLVQTKRLPSVAYITNKQRSLVAHWQNSPHYIRPLPPLDVIRYHQRNRQFSLTEAVLQHMGASLATDTAYVPAELTITSSAKKRPRPKAAAASASLRPDRTGSSNSTSLLAQLEARERDRPGKIPVREAVDNDALGGAVEEEEDDAAEDYTMNYYASEDDESEDGGDGGEATF